MEFIQKIIKKTIESSFIPLSSRVYLSDYGRGGPITFCYFHTISVLSIPSLFDIFEKSICFFDALAMQMMPRCAELKECALVSIKESHVRACMHIHIE